MKRSMQQVMVFGLLAVVFGGGISPAWSNVIYLPGTGTDANNNTLPGGSADPHYTVTGPGIPGGGPARVLSDLWYLWVPNDAHSAWINWKDNADSAPYGDYHIKLEFDLTGYDPTTASLSGSWAVDRYGYVVNLNGQPTGVALTNGYGPPENWNSIYYPNLNPFTISSGFQAGINELDFVVTEPDAFNGLRIRDLILTVDAVPEPTSLTLGGLFIAIGAAAYFGRKR